MTVADQLKKWAKGRDSAPTAKKPFPFPTKPDEKESVKDEDDEDEDDEGEVTPGSKSPLKDEKKDVNPLEAYRKKMTKNGKG